MNVNFIKICAYKKCSLLTCVHDNNIKNTAMIPRTNILLRFELPSNIRRLLHFVRF